MPEFNNTNSKTNNTNFLDMYKIFGNIHMKNAKNDRDTIIAVVGKRGVGKSYFCLNFGYMMKEMYGMSFDINKHVVFRIDDFMPVYESSKNTVIILDDVTTERIWNDPSVQMIRKNVLVGRKKHNLFFFIGPTLREMSVEYLSVFDYVLEIVSRTKNNTKEIKPTIIEINRLMKYAGGDMYGLRSPFASELGINIDTTGFVKGNEIVNVINPIIDRFIVRHPKITEELKNIYNQYDINRERMMEAIARETKEKVLLKLNKKEDEKLTQNNDLITRFISHLKDLPYEQRAITIKSMCNSRNTLSLKLIESKLRGLFEIVEPIKKEVISQISWNIEVNFSKELSEIRKQ